MKIIILGAGISGLTVAHELIEKGFEVEVFEKDSIAGGMARTFRNKDNVPTEHSWRGYGPFYFNAFEIMKRIPISENFGNNTEYSLEEIAKHNKKDDLWVIYKNKVYDVTYFYKNHPGGSLILKVGGKDVEKEWEKLGYSWHASNNNVIKQLKKNFVGHVKTTEKFSNNLTVYDNLGKNRLNFTFLYNERKGRGNVNLSKSDIFFLIFLFGKVILSNNRREEYFKIRLDTILKKNLSLEGYHFISDFLAGPGYGFDKNTMSLAHYAIFIEYSFYQNNKKWQVMNQPTSEAWINPWVNYLKNKGVKFHFNSEVKEIYHKNKIVSKCLINVNGKDTLIKGDEFIFCINPFNLEKIFRISKITKLADKLSNGNIINNQISFRLGFSKKINFDIKYGGFVLIDSPYNITFYLQEDHWKENIKLGMNGKIKSLMSGTIIRPYITGSLYKKSALSLSIEQLKEEITHQIFESKEFTKVLNKNNITKSDIIFKEVFNDWEKNGSYLKSKNLKWVNNSINEEFRLNNDIKFKNMYTAGSHTKTSIYVWSMEGAVESGKRTANIILNKYNKSNCYLYTHQSNCLVKFIAKFDDLIYSLNLPHLTLEIILFAFFIIIFNCIQKYLLNTTIRNS